jgi:hypothetical protein
LFTPRHPATKAKRWEVERAEAPLAIEDIVNGAIAEAVVEEVHFPKRRL